MANRAASAYFPLMNRFYAFLLSAALGLALAGPVRASDSASLTVVELFSSQGCDRCPPAIALLRELGERGDVLPLSYSVDYWDYMGWKDTFSDPAFSKRQEGYAAAEPGRHVYTPQIVIDGVDQMVGSKRDEVLAAVAARAEAGGETVPLTVAREDALVRISLAKSKLTAPATIWLVRYDKSQRVDIGSGENSGRSIDYINVVRELRMLGTWDGGPWQTVLNVAGLTEGGRDGCAVLVQEGETGPIIAAVLVPL